MTWADSGELPRSDSRTFLICAALASLLEGAALVYVGVSHLWLAHPRKPELDASRFVEAEVVQMPKAPAHLTEEKPVRARPREPVHHEPVLSKVPQQGRQAKPEERKLEDKNVTVPGLQYPPNHGPIAVYAPSPVIPSYLQSQDIHASVVIDFYVAASGSVTPRLVNSSGNDELDALALDAARRWQFRPAEKGHQPIDSKVRLRIVFEVH